MYFLVRCFFLLFMPFPRDLFGIRKYSTSTLYMLYIYMYFIVLYNYNRPFLLECSSKEVREDFCAILGHGLQSYCSENSIEVHTLYMQLYMYFIINQLESKPFIPNISSSVHNYTNLVHGWTNLFINKALKNKIASNESKEH